MSGHKWARDEPPPYNPGYAGQYPEEPVGARHTQQGPWAENRGYNWDNQGQVGYNRDNQGQPGYSRDNQGQVGYSKDNQRQPGYNWDNPGQAGYSRSARPTEDHWPRAQEMATVTGDIPEDGPAQDPLAEFTEKSIRRGFIRKVFAILAVQLLVTFAFIAIFVLVKDVKEFIQDPDHIWLMFAAMATTLVLVIVMACCEKVRRKFPQNLICLAVFTLAEAWLLGTVSSYYDADEVLMAVGICTGVTIVMFLFGLQSKFDFTWLVGPLISLTFSLLCFGLLCLIFRDKYLNLMYASLGALIFSLWITVDVQLVVGKGKYALDSEEYILAALNIYLDIINLFLFILKLVGGSK